MLDKTEGRINLWKIEENLESRIKRDKNTKKCRKEQCISCRDDHESICLYDFYCTVYDCLSSRREVLFSTLRSQRPFHLFWTTEGSRKSEAYISSGHEVYIPCLIGMSPQLPHAESILPTRERETIWSRKESFQLRPLNPTRCLSAPYLNMSVRLYRQWNPSLAAR